MVKQNHPWQTPPEIVEKMYLDWVDGMSVYRLYKKYKIYQATIAKYKQEQDWVSRRDKIQSVVAKRLDKSEITRKVRRAKLGVKLQAEGLKRVKRGIESEQVAVHAIKVGAELEDSAYGDYDETMEIKIKLPKGLKLGFKPYKSLENNE